MQKYYDAVEKLRMEYEQALEEYQIKQAEEDALWVHAFSLRLDVNTTM